MNFKNALLAKATFREEAPWNFHSTQGSCIVVDNFRTKQQDFHRGTMNLLQVKAIGSITFNLSEVPQEVKARSESKEPTE